MSSLPKEPVVGFDGDEARRFEERFDLLSETMRAFAEATGEPGVLLDTIARRTARALGDCCGIALVSEDGERLEPAAMYDEDASALALLRHLSAGSPLRMDGGHPVLRCLDAREPVLMPQMRPQDIVTRLAPQDVDAALALQVRAVLIAPLRAHGKSVGLLSIIRHGADALDFVQADRRLAQSLADHAALAITHARSLARAERELAQRRKVEDRLRMVTELSREFAAATHDYQALLDVVARRLAEILGDGCMVRLIADGGEHMELSTSVFHRDPVVAQRLSDAMRQGVQKLGSGVVGKVAQTGQPVLVPEVETEEMVALVGDRFKATALAIGMRGFAAVPLHCRGKAIGALVLLHSRHGQPYTDDDFRLLQDVASHAALAISNARLFSDSQRELAERKKAEQALRRTEAQLRQAQKMEAVGRLAGGIAHDFNNLLSVVLSYCSLLIGELAPGDAMRADLQEILRAGERAAELTRQLLAFSRQQVFEPRVLDLNAVIANMDKLLRRVLGENVALQMICSKDAGRVKADPGNLEQVIMNLVVNARDAMPDGGRLTIETARVELDERAAGERAARGKGVYVMLSVSDTGVGMDQATQQRVFEPFFTTKARGKGTGLGLSTVFGIVQQSGGSISFSSEPGRGTTFKLLLPRTEEALQDICVPTEAVSVRGSETVLLVEDEDQVRTVARGVLERGGYHILEARTGGEALRLCEEPLERVDLLLTDMVMPQMSGRELAERLMPKRPGMRVLYMSGYTDDAVVHDSVLAAKMAFLPKPFTPESLLRKVREVLDGPATPATQARELETA